MTAVVTCINCNPALSDAIFGELFWPRLLTLLGLLPLLAAAIALVAYVLSKRSEFSGAERRRVFLTLAALLTLGCGLGGFIDGIVLHQILQWHEMFSNRQPPITWLDKSVNMFWDGVFHLSTWFITLGGLIWLWCLFQNGLVVMSNNVFVGGLLLGWSVFNLVEGIVDHHVLKVHNVNEASANPELYNWLFTGISILLFAVGWWLVTTGFGYTRKRDDFALAK